MPEDKQIFNKKPEKRRLLWASKSQIEKLLNLPENGMGYQIIEATIHVKNNVIRDDFLVLNCEYLLPFNDNKQFVSFPALLEKRLSIIKYIENDANKIAIEEIIEPKLKKNLNSLILINKNKGIMPDIYPIILWHPKLMLIEQTTTKHEVFYRYSAFPNDRRIDEHGNFHKGTFASTIRDIHMTHSGFAATGRYALPNPDSAKYVYVILTEENTKIFKGTVSPAYNQAGGGVEVFFPNGAINQPGRPYLIDEA